MKRINFLKSFLITALVVPLTASAYNLIPSETDSLLWHQATVLSVFASPSKSSFVSIQVESPRPDVKLPVRIWRTTEKVKKGVVILIPGTGSGSNSSQAAVVADTIALAGYDSIVIANPYSLDFQKTFSSDYLIGFPEHDTPDLVKMMNAAYKAYVQRYGKAKVINVVGISLGGMYAMRLPTANNPLKIHRYIAINPPVDLGYAIDKLDQAVQIRLNSNMFSLKEVLINNLLPLADLTWVRGVRLSWENLIRIKAALSENEYDNMGLIGMSFQGSLIEIALGLRKSEKFSSLERRHWLSRQLSYLTFGKYMGFVGVALEDKVSGGSFKDQLAQEDLRVHIANAPDKSKLFVLTSADDFLLQKDDVADLDRQMGPNFQVFKSGGHCGQLWTQAFQSALKGLLK